MSYLDKITKAAPDAVFGVSDAFKQDPTSQKINLSVGAYRDDAGKPWVLPVVHEAEKRILASGQDKEYLPMSGLPAFRKLAAQLLFGDDEAVLSRVACVQTLSGTGALRVCGEFLKQFHPSPVIYVTDPT
jgi:aspartate aminotransferase